VKRPMRAQPRQLSVRAMRGLTLPQPFGLSKQRAPVPCSSSTSGFRRGGILCWRGQLMLRVGLVAVVDEAGHVGRVVLVPASSVMVTSPCSKR